MTRPTIDPNVFLPSASAGKAAIIVDPSNTFVTNVITNLNNISADLDSASIPATTGSVETKTSGALTTTIGTSFVSVTGTVAFTLADGATVGQMKHIECTVAATSPLGTLTITTPLSGESSTHVFTAVGQSIDLIWGTGGWHMFRKTRAGHQVLVIGTTLTAGLDLAYTYDLSVTATVSSTTTKALPNGTVPGERCHIDVTTAASSASGTLGFTGMSAVGAAVTQAAGIGNGGTDKTFVLALEWSGAEWQIVYLGTNTGVTIS